MAKEMQVLPRRRGNSPEQVQRLFIAGRQLPRQRFRQQHGVVSDHYVCDHSATVVADGVVQISSTHQRLFAIHLIDGGAQRVVGLDLILTAVNTALQLRIAKIAQRIDAAN